MFVKPQNGLMVTDPDRGDHLPVEGRRVEDNQYWQRRLLDGDVVEVVDQADAPSKTKQKE